MRLTTRGKEYLVATGLVLLITGFAGPPMLAALGLSLSVAAASSLSLAWFSSRDTRITAEPRRLRVFKGEGAVAMLRLETGTGRWLRMGGPSLEEVPGLESNCKTIDRSSFELNLKPVCAGRFELPTIQLDVTDVMGLFVRQETVTVDLTVDSLPLALLAPARAMTASPLAVGEIPAGRIGSGQELFAVGEYHPDSDTKDILWKRVARMEDGSIPVRVREANIRMSVRVGIALSWTSLRERAERVDLVSEALAQMGRLFLSLGTNLEVLFPLGSALERRRASNVAELADLLMVLSETSSSVEPIVESAKCDMLVLGPDQLNGLSARSTRVPCPVVVVSETTTSSLRLPDVAIFTGLEDLSAVSVLVLNR